MEDLELRFNSLIMENPFVPMAELQSRIIQHYIRQGIQQVYKILGCQDALGNPVGLFTNIGSGVMDFFYEPAKGIIEGPQAFAKGLAKGTASLVKNTVYATFNSAGKVVGALGKGVATLSCDDEYVKRRQANQRKKPKHFLDGAAQGALALGRGFFDGVTGIIVKPVQGVRREGAVGLFKGIGQGVIGVAVKPIAGVLEMTSKTAEGIKNTTTVFDEDTSLYRVRGAPRQFTKNKQLIAFNAYECEGLVLLSQHNDLSGDKHVLHMQIESEKKKEIRVVLLSSNHFAVMLATDEKYVYKTDVIVALKDITSKERAENVISLTIKDRKKPVKLTMQSAEDTTRLFDELPRLQ